LGDADDADLTAEAGPAGGHVADADPVNRGAHVNFAAEDVQDADQKGLLERLGLVTRPVLERADTAALVDGSGFVELGFEDFAVFAANGGGEEVVGEGEKGGAAEGEEERVPQAEAKGDVAAEGVKEGGGHRRGAREGVAELIGLTELIELIGLNGRDGRDGRNGRDAATLVSSGFAGVRGDKSWREEVVTARALERLASAQGSLALFALER